jgi:hypothetical protein
LAVEILFRDAKALDFECHAFVQNTKSPNNPMLDWAIDYMSQLPDNAYDRKLIKDAHTAEINNRDYRRAWKALDIFYSKLRERDRRLYQAGRRYLMILAV